MVKVAINSKQKRFIRVSQSDVPSNKLESALRIPKAIAENYACQSVTPLQLAQALDMSPQSSSFRTLTGTAVAFGLTTGAYNASTIDLTELGKRIVKPLKEGDDLIAKREAIFKPKVLNEFLNKYNGSPLPRQDIACNVLEQQMGVPADRTSGVYDLIVESAEEVGLIKEIKGKKYVDLSGATVPSKDSSEIEGFDDEHTADVIPLQPHKEVKGLGEANTRGDMGKNRRVFITHGKNKAFVEPIKKLLQFGELEPVVSVEKQSVSQPVTDKVMRDMRSCGAAIIHVEDEQKLLNTEAEEQIILNPNVLIEIGAAMALYGKRFILLVKQGVELPSNLQGLYEVRYSGDDLGSETTIKLLEAINSMKKEPEPTA